MSVPKRVKYRGIHRGRMKGKASKSSTLTYGDYGIQALDPCWLVTNQVETVRRAMTRYIERGGNIWVEAFPDKPVPKKSIDTRVDSGKEASEYWVTVTKLGKISLKMAGIPEDVAREAMRPTQHKPSIKVRFIAHEEFGKKDGETDEN